MDCNQVRDKALHFGYFYSSSSKDCCNKPSAPPTKEDVSANIGGEFGIGGIFNVARQHIANKIYEKWEEFSPT